MREDKGGGGGGGGETLKDIYIYIYRVFPDF